MTESNILSKENIVEEVYLTSHDDFVKVNGLYYGGLQKWLYTEKLRLKFWADRSCGLIAAANALVHMATYKQRLQGLYIYPSLSKSNFIRFTNDIYGYVKPTVVGIPTLGKLKKGLRTFAKSKGINLNSKSLSMPKNINMSIEFIKEGLMLDSPVLMLTWNTKIKNLNYHWVTITGYFKTRDGKGYVITSNWGDREIFSLDEWISERSFNKGLIYFYG